jgi:hypothetical protein
VRPSSERKFPHAAHPAAPKFTEDKNTRLKKVND